MTERTKRARTSVSYKESDLESRSCDPSKGVSENVETKEDRKLRAPLMSLEDKKTSTKSGSFLRAHKEDFESKFKDAIHVKTISEWVEYYSMKRR